MVSFFILRWQANHYHCLKFYSDFKIMMKRNKELELFKDNKIRNG